MRRNNFTLDEVAAALEACGVTVDRQKLQAAIDAQLPKAGRTRKDALAYVEAHLSVARHIASERKKGSLEANHYASFLRQPENRKRIAELGLKIHTPGALRFAADKGKRILAILQACPLTAERFGGKVPVDPWTRHQQRIALGVKIKSLTDR